MLIPTSGVETKESHDLLFLEGVGGKLIKICERLRNSGWLKSNKEGGESNFSSFCYKVIIQCLHIKYNKTKVVTS